MLHTPFTHDHLMCCPCGLKGKERHEPTVHTGDSESADFSPKDPTQLFLLWLSLEVATRELISAEISKGPLPHLDPVFSSLGPTDPL